MEMHNQQIYILEEGVEKGPFTWVEILVGLRKGRWTPACAARIHPSSYFSSIDELGLWNEGEEAGPFTWDEIQLLIHEGILTGDVQAKLDGESELTSLNEVIDRSREVYLADELPPIPVHWWTSLKLSIEKLLQNRQQLRLAAGVGLLLGVLALAGYYLTTSSPTSAPPSIVALVEPPVPAAPEETPLISEEAGENEPAALVEPESNVVAMPSMPEITTNSEPNPIAQIAPNPGPTPTATPEPAAVIQAPTEALSTVAVTPSPTEVAQNTPVLEVSSIPQPTPSPTPPMAITRSASNFFEIGLITFHKKVPKSGILAWKVVERNNVVKDYYFQPCLQVPVSVDADVRYEKLFAKAYFYGPDNKLLAAVNTPSPAGRRGQNLLGMPLIFLNKAPTELYFAVPAVALKTTWKAVVVFGDKDEAQIATYPAGTVTMRYDFPERKIVDNQVRTTVARKIAMDPLIQHVVKTKNPKMPQITLFLRPPKGISDAADVKGVLAICVLAGSVEEIKRELRKEELTGDYNGLFKFANENKLAILVWGSRSLWRADLNYDELPKAQAREIDESFDLVAEAWGRGVRELGDKYGIPEKDFLLWGNCGSAQWAARLCLRQPEYFLATYIHQPGSYDQPTPEAAKVLWCLTIGELEGGYERSKRFVTACRKLGYPMVYKAIPELGHSGHPLATAMSFEFFSFALQQQEKRDTMAKGSQRMVGAPGSAPWLESFSNPPFYGDMVNQEMFPADQVDMIPAGFRIPLPNQKIADIWASN